VTSDKSRRLFIILFSFLIFYIPGVIGGNSYIPLNASAQSTFPNFNFAAVGDWDCGSPAVETRDSIVAVNPELVVGLGDYSYESNADCWLDIVDPIDGQNPGLDGKMEIAIGNHEIEESSQSLEQYLDHFNMPNQYHSFNLNNIHFLVLATDDSFGVNSNQHTFAVNDLQAASSNPNIDWIVVAFHKPLYDVPCSSDSCDGEDAFRNIYHPLFDQFGVDLVLYGHAHNYVRTFPIQYDSSTPDSPIITSTSPNNYVDPDGQVFVQSGAGGRSLRDLTGTESYNAFQSDSEYGILNIDVINNNINNNLQLSAKFIQNDGDVIDQFTITKQGGSTPPAQEICTNGVDDDGDGKIDIQDPDCQSPEQCTDGIDNDGDGKIDAADSDCQTGYHYSPFFTTTGTNRVDVADSPSLRLSSFTVATWFKTTGGWSDEGIMVNKGGLGSESAGANQNYGLWFTSSDQLEAGFEVTGGSNRYITSTSSTNYLDNQWHHAVVTFDNANNIVRLFVDGLQVGTLSTTSNPDNTGTQPLRIGENSQSPLGPDAFVGQLDEVGVWSRALTNAEVTSLMNLRADQFPINGLVYRNSFGTSTPPEVCNDNIDNDGDGKIDAADSDCQTPPPSSNKLTPISVVASAQESGKEASKAADGDFATRWSANGNGQWIEFTFNNVYPITKVGLTGYHYDKAYMFEINGKQFVNQANRPPGTLIEYDLSDLNIQSNKVRITGHGNSESDYNSYREIQFYTR
jgi:Concanavalin A-like lectin/glucanases superfamily/Calcineurin-like phosphoesterase/F5/8 type C domain